MTTGGVINQREADALLVERVKQGDQRAFALLVAKYERRVQRLLSRLVRDSAEIEDITQEAFIKAYRALPQFRGESAFYTWLYRIAINTAKNYLATKSRRPVTVGEFQGADDGEFFDLGDVVEDNNTPDAVLHSRQVAEAVNAAMEALPEDLKAAITLREIEGLSYEEIAQAMDCPIGTVRSRIFRAREAIAQRLRPLLGTKEDERW
ncbi:RpoE DNA-directed RNA polymerase specialized sigma subunit, sigma24 homolog [Burkholderiales bacterium]